MQRDGPVHCLEIGSTANADRPERHATTAQQQRVEHDAGSRQARPDQADVSAHGERFDGVRERTRPADFDDAIGPLAIGQLDDSFVPVRRFHIVDHGGSAERLEPFRFCRG